MLSRLLLSYKTSSFVKKRHASTSRAFSDSMQIGVLYTYSDSRHCRLVSKLIANLEKLGKKVSSLAYIANMSGQDEYNFAHCNTRDLDFWGRWTNEEVLEFTGKPFDYLLNLDCCVNDVTQNILAKSKARCRVGRFEQGKHDYFELMIEQKENDYEGFIEQMYHCIRNVRNGK